MEDGLGDVGVGGPAATSVIEGRVVDHVGAPIEGARVLISAAPSAVPDVAILTDEIGRFALDAPTAGRYLLACHAHGFTSATLETVVTAGSARSVGSVVLERE